MATEKLSLLLVEDDDQDAFLVRRLLESRREKEFTVQHVSTAADAIQCLTEGEIEVVLLDLGLPDSQGFETVLRIRTSFPSIAIVVLTGIDDESIGLRAIECGAQDYVSKDAVAGQLLFRAIRFAAARHNQITQYKMQARTDTLTGLANRRAFDAELKRMVGGWRRSRHTFALLLLDIDHFKDVNDTYGHRAGDFVLSHLAEVIGESMRDSDLAARFGGEEFAIVLPDTELDGGLRTAERLMQSIRSADFCFEDMHLEITASAGVAVVNESDDADSLVERTDTALYAAKDAGRDRAFFHDGQQCQPADTYAENVEHPC